MAIDKSMVEVNQREGKIRYFLMVEYHQRNPVSFKLELKAKRMGHLTSKCFHADKGQRCITEAAKSYNSCRGVINMQTTMTWENIKRQYSHKKFLKQKQEPQ